jgi:glycosyltransferase involved in cell wall biosynthesis
MASMTSNYCCYFDHRYLPRGVAMIRSLKRWDPSAVVWVLCLSDECFDALSELGERGVNLVRIEDLETAYPALAEARKNRSTIEFYFTCTPSLVRFVLAHSEEDAVVTYVDGDLFFFADPQPLFAELGQNSVSIIPHRFPPRLSHLEKFGLYNVGWMSFRNDPRGQAVATWWQDRCNEWCYDILDGDRFADQKYLDRIATEFDGVVVLSHRGANLAPWNLGGHRLTLRNNGVVVDGQWPLIFFHFHGLKRVGDGLYIPDHFRYRAPFIGLIRGRIYRPYIQVLEAISRETASYFVAPAATLARYASKGMGFGERLTGWLKKPAKYALAIVTGEFIVVRVPARNTFVANRTSSVPVRVDRLDGGRSKLRVIVVHNYYGSSAPSGENNAVNAEIAMLRRHGHEVHTFTRESDEIRDDGLRGLMHGGLTFPWNPLEISRLKKFMHAIKPEVVHVHNTFPLISPGVFWAIRDCAASVLTMHNYRLFCSSGLLLRDGAICTRCLDESSVLPALRYGCYRHSRIATLPVAHSIALHQSIGTWRTRVDAFIAVTEFQRDKMVAAGLPAERVHVKSNFFAGNPSVMSWGGRRNAALYVGRLTAEKGVEHLIRGWLELGAGAPPLRIVGDGELRSSLEALATSRGAAKVEFLGAVAPEAAVREVAEARLLFIPSIGLEGFPIVLQEAFAAGTPCAVSDVGALPILVRDGANGLVFKARDAAAIAEFVRRVWADDALLARISAGARASFEANYTEEINHQRLMEIYETALARRERVLGGSLRVASAAPPGG